MAVISSGALCTVSTSPTEVTPSLPSTKAATVVQGHLDKARSLKK
jgi:hypothetical protein